MYSITTSRSWARSFVESLIVYAFYKGDKAAFLYKWANFLFFFFFVGEPSNEREFSVLPIEDSIN